MMFEDTTAPSQTEAIAFEVSLRHSPKKVWRALTEPALVSEWLLPMVEPKPEFARDQKTNFGGARYGWRLMGARLVALLDATTSEPVA